MKLSDYCFKFLKDYGVKHVFTLVGGGAMHLCDSLGKSGISYTCNLHEQACSIAASSYAQYKNELGVCLVTTGPGGTNAITGVAGAWLDSIPMLVISGQVKRSDLRKFHVRQYGFQELNILDVVKPITKYAEMVDRPDDIKYHLEKAIYFATSDRKSPVWLDIPLDIQASEIDETSLFGYICKDTKQQYPFLKEQVTKVVESLNQAKRPVILVGNGVRLSNAIPEFYELVNTLGIPVLTTWKAIDLFDEDNPLYCDRPGAVGQRGANFIQQNADWLLTIGARLDLGQTAYSHEKFAPKATKIMVDVDYAEINKMGKSIKYGICADAKEFIQEMLNNRDLISYEDNGWLKRCGELKAKYPVVLPEYYQETEYVNVYAFIDALSKVMKEDDVLIPASSGGAAEITMQAFKVKKGQRIFNTEGLGAMGFGISSAIGACIASGKRTICIEGDGSFAMNTQELETIRRLHLPIKIFVLNNWGYASIRQTQDRFFNGHYVGSSLDSGLTLPSIRGMAEGYGIYYDKIRSNFRLEMWVDEWVNNTLDSVIIEVMVNPKQETKPRVVSKQLSNGSMESGKMEDMFPYLSEEELKEAMRV